MPEHTNRLIHESSPYLRQHAHNPVDWYPWGDEAFTRARREGKPILLSIGYSACHWCHVMERESFENEEIARLMNEHFVNIKVDREERPDVDHIYMTAIQMLTGRGGWPMTVFLDPDGKPFYGGTYFPPEDRHGMPAFPRVLLAVAQAYRERPDDVQHTAAQLMERLAQLESPQPGHRLPGREAVLEAAAQLARAHDSRYGGIGQAPKFPNAAVYELFLRVGRQTGDARFVEMTTTTLRRMAEGGIYDQLGGGFHRYSVDERWLVPHFEKMLYDNAQLVPLYLATYQVTGERFFAGIARETLDYALREMRHPEGGFYSSQDADSEGEEGRFFVWDREEVVQLLGPEVGELACRYWDITDEGNFEGHNILHVTLDVESLATMFRRDHDTVRRQLAAARATLFEARERRVRPGLDTKVLTSWNGLMISAFAKAAEVLGGEYLRVARDAVAFIERHLQRGDRLLSTWTDGTPKLNGYLDDYAFVIAALLDVFEAGQERRHLEAAVRLTDSMIAHFWDGEAGGFFFTSDDHEALIVRSKPSFDGSIPSGNSIAAMDLLRLYHYTERAEYLERADAILRLFADAMHSQPFGFVNLFAAVDFRAAGPREIAVVGPAADPATQALLERIRHTYIPNRTLLVLDPSSAAPRPALLDGKTAVDGRPTVYVCHQRTCSPPATEWEQIAPLLTEGRPPIPQPRP